jgi:hypothetical protein
MSYQNVASVKSYDNGAFHLDAGIRPRALHHPKDNAPLHIQATMHHNASHSRIIMS